MTPTLTAEGRETISMSDILKGPQLREIVEIFEGEPPVVCIHPLRFFPILDPKNGTDFYVARWHV